MRLYIFEVRGVWVPGYAFAIAESEAAAIDQIREATPDYLKEKDEFFELKGDYPLDSPQADVIYDGEM